MKLFRPVSLAGLALALVACETAPVDPTGYPCASQSCMQGWACHPQLLICVPDIRVACDGTGTCPEEIETGTPCAAAAADGFLPCFSGDTGCEHGCRTCDAETGWGECICELGTLTNCGTCGDDCSGIANVVNLTCDETSEPAACAFDSCAPGWVDVDGEPGCELACTITGDETCNGLDDDCDSFADDMTLIEARLDCENQNPSAVGVSQWRCTGGSCQLTCADDNHDIDGLASSGCEYACVIAGAESCNGADDDCNGDADDMTQTDLDADCAAQHPLAGDVSAWDCAGGCTIDTCATNYYDINGVLGDGCEYACTAAGAETCNGADDDCNGPIDDIADVQADCAAQYPGAVHVLEWGCASACEIRACENGWVNLTGGIADGCEINCTPTVPPDETCDGVDNDCDGITDNEGSPGCTTYYRDVDNDDAGVDGDSRCLCVAIDPYTATAGGDCDDSKPHCQAVCTDNDNDGYCADQDCDDRASTGGTCFQGCSTYYRDEDDDDLGVATNTVFRCRAPSGYIGSAGDCDDTNPNCGTSCTDVDLDTYCVGVDCNDGNANCTTDCADADSDLVCAPQDCNDNDNGCTFDCALCAPVAVDVTASSPASLCANVPVTLDFGGSGIPLASEITCSAPRVTLAGLTTFESGLGRWSTTTDVSIKGWPGGYPASCPGSGSYAALAKRSTASTIAPSPKYNATGYQTLQLSMVYGFKSSPPASEHLAVRSCCGASCTLTTRQQFPGNASTCLSGTTSLSHNNCANVGLEVSWTSDISEAAVDDLRLSGVPTIPAVTNQGVGIFTTSVTSCERATIAVTCTWNNGVDPPLSDSATIVFQ